MKVHKIIAEVHHPSSIFLCNGFFTGRVIFRQAFLATITVFDVQRMKKMHREECIDDATSRESFESVTFSRCIIIKMEKEFGTC